ncbi:MAG: hypothetical protein COS99_04455 [Candidatus Omnitrophica bacterium CG07_land_8_20_14_0_80_42_15]|uniref:RNA-binding protein n=1 Tax=Candidatus Aquitaenariimonas noxiae TaxID=1974741 RepID=A0A2J0KZ03_9BACT|nr:MAG: hypothetical protein COS99_04455 [Candidatus Omnitrophica bacterium CG07_land_8_20_14_0_80_42_15]
MKALVVDGYNAIYKIAYLKKIMDRSPEEARKEITALAKEYQRKCGGIDRVYVVFDGKDAYRENAFTPPPNQIFSRTGEGDEEVVRVVSCLYKKYHVEVVTDDNFIRNNSRSYNASITPVGEFAACLDKKHARSAKKGGENKVTPDAAFKINEDLKKYWNIK